jgi:ADP-ribose pyrophosphatase
MPEPTDARVLFAGRYLSVVSETWPGMGEWEVLRKYPASAIVPLTPNGDVVLIRQFRIPVRQELLEVPAGLLDVPGEDALTCAERELYEETGYRSHNKLPRGAVPVAGDDGRLRASLRRAYG